MKIKFVKLDANVPTPDGPGQSLDSAHVDEGYEIHDDGTHYCIRHSVRWPTEFMRVPHERAMGDICLIEGESKVVKK